LKFICSSKWFYGPNFILTSESHMSSFTLHVQIVHYPLEISGTTLMGGSLGHPKFIPNTNHCNKHKHCIRSKRVDTKAINTKEGLLHYYPFLQRKKQKKNIIITVALKHYDVFGNWIFWNQNLIIIYCANFDVWFCEIKFSKVKYNLFYF
jgi:hypothetical protein